MGIIHAIVNPKAPITPGRVDITHYIIKRLLSEGSYGQVLLAEHQNGSGQFAIKMTSKRSCLKKEGASSQRLKAVWREQRLTQRMRCSFVVHSVQAFQDEEYCYLVHPYLPGGNLADLAKSNPMSERRVRFYAAEMICALEYLHSRGVCHRDMKPNNVMLDSEGHVHLIDFGIAGWWSEATYLTSKVGTPNFMPPEIHDQDDYRGEPDFFALGVILYFLRSQELPYSSKKEILSKETVNMKPVVDRKASDGMISLLQGLLEKNMTFRLGCGADGIPKLKQHAFFRGVNWEDVANRKLKPPFVPGEKGVINVDEVASIHLRKKTDERPLTQKEQSRFKNYGFNDECEDTLLDKHYGSYLGVDRRSSTSYTKKKPILPKKGRKK
eukprot:841081_1